MRLLQITDSHFGARFYPGDPAGTLAAVVQAVRALPQRPDAAIHTGDLTEHGQADEYDAVAAALDQLGIPLHPIPGNHDDRAALRGRFAEAVGGRGADPIEYVVQLEGLRLIMVDSTVPGQPQGQLDGPRLGRLAGALAADPVTPALVAMHHPPFLTGLPGMDRIGLPVADRIELSHLLTDHPQLAGIVSGHVHGTIVTSFAGRPALTIPGTYSGVGLDFEVAVPPSQASPLGFAVHTLVDGRLISHVATLPVTAATV